MTRDPKWLGIRPHGSGFRATVSQGRARPQIQRHFPKGTDVAVMQAWREQTQAKHVIARKQRASRGTFEGDAKRYLKAVAAMPTFTTRERHIHQWIAEFGTRQRDAITAADIRTVRDKWMTTPRSATDNRPLGPASINLRLRALSNLWTVLDGPRAENPVRDVPELQEPQPAPRHLDYGLVAQVLDLIPECRAKRQLTVMAYTGWPSGVMAQLTAADVDLETGVARLPARRKGFGAPGVTVPLLPQAVDALRAYPWGKPVHPSVLRRVLKRAAVKVGIGWLRPYDFRHLYASTLAQASGDERAAQSILQHASLATTRRYTLRGVPARIVTAVERLARHLSGTVARHSGQTPAADLAVSGRKRPRDETERNLHDRAKVAPS